MRGDVEVKYVRCVSEFNSGSGDDVSSADKTHHSLSASSSASQARGPLTSSIVQLGRDAHTGPILRREGIVRLAHSVIRSLGQLGRDIVDGVDGG